MDKRWICLVTIVLCVLCVPLMAGAKCNSDTAASQPSAEEQVKQVPLPEGAEFFSALYEPGTTDKSSAAIFISKEPMGKVAGFYDQQLAGQEGLERVGKYSPAYIYTNEEGKVVVVRCETQETGTGYTNIYISAYDKDEYDALKAQVEAEVVPMYPGAMVDSSPDAVMKAESVGGEMYFTPDSIDKVRAFFESELAGMEGYAKQGNSRYTYTNSTGQNVDIMVIQAGPEGVNTNILVTKK
jgi:hypothetical protein